MKHQLSVKENKVEEFNNEDDQNTRNQVIVVAIALREHIRNERIESTRKQKKLRKANDKLRAELFDVRSELSKALWEVLPIENKSFHILGLTDEEAFESSDRIRNYELCEVLGSGQFSDVRKGIDTQTQKEVAIKVISKSNVDTVEYLQKICFEIDALQRMRHPNIIDYIGTINAPKHLYIIMQKGDLDLYDFMESTGDKPEPEISREIFYGVLLAMAHLHKNGICHRDLKPENILLCNTHEALGITHENVKVCDLGSCIQEKAMEVGFSDFIGTPGFFAPEMILSSDRYNGFKVDTWSIGCILLEMVIGSQNFCTTWMPAYESAYADQNNFRTSIAEALEMITEWLPGEEDVTDFLRKTLTMDPAHRWQADELSKHPWLQDFKTIERKARSPTSKKSSSPIKVGNNRPMRRSRFSGSLVLNPEQHVVSILGSANSTLERSHNTQFPRRTCDVLLTIPIITDSQEPAF